jgi:molecular chaperone GrpE (heat shock protein)
MPISDPFDDVDVIRKISTKKKVDTEKDKDRKQAIGLLENAIDFFERAMAAINNDPKESIINFSTAVELILKFR